MKIAALIGPVFHRGDEAVFARTQRCLHKEDRWAKATREMKVT